VLAASEDPLARVFDLDSGKYGRGLIIGLCGALLVHIAGASEASRLGNGVGGWALDVRANVQSYLSRIYDVEYVPPPPPPPPPPPEEPPPPEPKAPPPPPTPAPKTAPKEEPRAAPAQAGKVLTQEPKPDEPVDLTGMGFVTGTADTYAGGVTSNTGTSTKAVRNLNAGPGGVPAGTGSAAAPPRPDIAQPASLAGGTDWDCPYPPEARDAQIEFQRVQIVITVAPDGSAQQVNVVSDPGHGFGRAAKECARRQRYNAARDRDGRPVLSTMPPIFVRFKLE
jgi:protein TonB